jgi:hypothetical protein
MSTGEIPIARAKAIVYAVTRFECPSVSESFKSSVIGVFQVFHRLAQHLRARANHLFQVLLVVVAVLQGLPMIERPLYRRHQVLALKGLQQVVIGATAHRIDCHADIMNRADHHHRQLRLVRVNALQQRNPVPILHHNVGQDQVKWPLSQHLYSLRAADRKLHIVPLALQRRADHRSNRSLVVDDQYARGSACPHVSMIVRAGWRRHRGGTSTEVCQVRC